MPITSGTRIGPYEITAEIGAGGMGVVYRARDTRLKRDVALKVLPETVAADPERLARFQREAEVLAALSHPHIGHIYGIEEQDGVRALVLELVEGGTLADRLVRGPLPADEALQVAKQVAEALEAAHEKGIVHRDLKPSNIAFTADDQVKVLDFGLAKIADTADAAGAAPLVSNSPTLTSPALLTGAGVLLGTAAYMSPEQAKGQEADRRCDIWAFGCVLYEMLTGRRAFDGTDVGDTLAAVLRAEPDWSHSALQQSLLVTTVVRQCLSKDRRRRPRDIGDVWLLLDGTLRPAAAEAEPSRVRRGIGWWVGAAALATGALVTAGLLYRPAAEPSVAPPVRVEARLGVDASLPTTGAPLALSPDGSTLVFSAYQSGQVQKLYVRSLDQFEASVLPGTDGASNPFFSPDGQWVAFFAQGKLRKVPISGGAAVDVSDAPGPGARDGSWADAGMIVFSGSRADSNDGSPMRVPAAGGAPEPLAVPGPGGAQVRHLQVLPGGALLYTMLPGGLDYEAAAVDIVVLSAGAAEEPKVVVRGGYFGRYLSSGHLTFVREGTLFVAPFDVDRLDVTGPAVPLVQDIVTDPRGTGGAHAAFSKNGTLVYSRRDGDLAPIDWIERGGRTSRLRDVPSNWSNPSLSPDGTRLALDIAAGTRTDIWVYEWARDTLSRLTFDDAFAERAVWTPDGRRIAFRSGRDNGAGNLYWQRADGSGETQRLTESANQQRPYSWDPSGRVLAFHEDFADTGSDVLLLPVEGNEQTGWTPAKPVVFLRTRFNERNPSFSPDGRWIAYASNESGRFEIYVRPYPAADGKWQVSAAGGNYARWSRETGELVYIDPTQQVIAVPYTVADGAFRAGKPMAWVEQPVMNRPRDRDFDIDPTGKRLVAAAEVEDDVQDQHVAVIFNSFDEIRRIAPAGQAR